MSDGPVASRPHIPGYGLSKSAKGLLGWEVAVERLEASMHYWLATTSPGGKPHVNAIWGVWVDDALYFGGGPDVRWARNLRVNPAAAAHLESGDEVVIIEGQVDLVESDRD